MRFPFIGIEGMLSCSFDSICGSDLYFPLFAFLCFLSFIFDFVKSASFISVYVTTHFGGSLCFSISIPAFFYARLLSLLLLS